MEYPETYPAVRSAMRRFELAMSVRRTREKLDLALDLLDRSDNFERSEDRDKAVALLMEHKRYRLAEKLGITVTTKKEN